MSFICPSRVLSLFSSSSVKKNAEVTLTLTNGEVLVWKGAKMNIIVPKCPLATDSVQIVPNASYIDYSRSSLENPISTNVKFAEWRNENHEEAQYLIQKVVQAWQKKGITDYLIYGKESANSTTGFSWEVVPYPKSFFRFWKQFKVLLNTTFGGAISPLIVRQRAAKVILKDLDMFSASPREREQYNCNFIKDCVFCPQPQAVEAVRTSKCTKITEGFLQLIFRVPKVKPNAVDRQLVFEGRTINVLYNYAPIAIGEGKLHFLIVPKSHCSKFSDLTKIEYLEAMALSQKLINFYKIKRYATAYLFDKSGKEAGQTVPHWHEHIVFTNTKTQEFFGKLTVLRNMIFGSWPLSKMELTWRVVTLKKDLYNALK